jgi:hypothetical protein
MITVEQEKAIASLKRAIARCEKERVGIIAEDDSLIACNRDDFDDFDNTPWDFLRVKQYEDDMIVTVKTGDCFLGSGGV